MLASAVAAACITSTWKPSRGLSRPSLLGTEWNVQVKRAIRACLGMHNDTTHDESSGCGHSARILLSPPHSVRVECRGAHGTYCNLMMYPAHGVPASALTR